jgi:hypothetical protein
MVGRDGTPCLNSSEPLVAQSISRRLEKCFIMPTKIDAELAAWAFRWPGRAETAA